MDVKDLICSVSLKEYIEANSPVDLSKSTVNSTYVLYHNCPFCSHHDHFAIYINSNKFCSFSNCYNSDEGKSTGDILDFIMWQENVEKVEAIKILEDYVGESAKKYTKNIPLEGVEMNNIEIKYNEKKYDFTNDCLNAIAIGTQGMDYYLKRGLDSNIVQSYMLGYTTSFNDFFAKNYTELQKPEFYSANLYNYVIPNVSVVKDDNGNYNTYIDYVMFRGDEDKIKEINKSNAEKGKTFKLGKYKKVLPVDTLFNERYLSGNLPEKFNLIKYKDTNTLYIVEGQFDALSIEQNNYHALSLNSVNNVNRLLELIKENLNNLTNIKFKVMFDNDDAGVTAANKVVTELNKLNLDCEIINFPKKFHDVNDFYINSTDDFITVLENHNALSESFSYIKNELDYVDNYYEKIMTAEKDTCIPTGFTKFDAALGGGFFPGVYVLGGVPGAGKTALANVFADRIAKSGHLTSMFSLELSKDEVLNRSISQMSFEKEISKYNSFTEATMRAMESNCLTMNDMKRHYRLNSNPKKVSMLKECITDYKKTIAQNKIIVKQDIIGTTAMTIRNKIQDIITRENRKPFVVIDYLQRLKNDTAKDNLSAISESIATLKQIAIDFEIPILLITSYNRGGYNTSANMSQGKGSGDIEYTADCIIAVQFRGHGEDGFTQEQINKLMEGDIRDLEVVFLKNRNWKVGIKTELSYIPAFNVVEEN